MVLVALIVLVTLIIRQCRDGRSWPMAMLTGVKRYLQGLIVIAGLLLVLVVGIGTTRAILHPVADAALDLFPEGQPAASRAGRRLAVVPTEMPAEVTAPLPTPTPRTVVVHTPEPRVHHTPTSLFYEAVGESGQPSTPDSATRTPTPSPEPTAPPATPAATPTNKRTGCDPAYPDAETCIPPGPPFDQGCAITDERRFIVLPPDPQGLDRDKNGIGCEPVA